MNRAKILFVAPIIALATLLSACGHNYGYSRYPVHHVVVVHHYYAPHRIVVHHYHQIVIHHHR